MNNEAMVAEILKRVQDKINALGLQEGEISSSACEVKSALPGLLILTADHGTRCDSAFQCSKLNANYNVDCALYKDYAVNVDDYEVVIAYTLTNELLGKLANGIFDDNYTRLFGKALLSGKKIYVPKEEVELYEYKTVAPKPYYQRLVSNLKLLEDSGVVVVPMEKLADILVGGCSIDAKPEPKVEAEPVECPAAEEPAVCSGLEVTIAKRLITEGDIRNNAKADRIIIDNKALLTDLAKEWAAKEKITILRENLK